MLIDRGTEGSQANLAALLHLEEGARVVDATVLTDAASLRGVEAQFDAAVVDGVLEHEPWDRWVLQRVHRVLRMDAPVVVAVPPLMTLVSATDARFLAYASRKVLERILQRWRPQLRLPGAVHRRYHIARLVPIMESLGYTCIEVLALAPRLIVRARKGSSLWGIQGRAWPDADVHRRRYAQRYAPLLAARDAWLSTFPRFRGATPRALDPSEWRGGRVLVLAPHPDDELIGCGGTLCRLVSAGARVSIVQATDGSKLSTMRELPETLRKTVRIEESRRVAAAMGAGLSLWRQEDEQLRCSGRMIAQLARLLREQNPTQVFTPFLGDMHADHRTLSLILGGALREARLEPQVVQYEVWSLVPANLYCDITEQAQTLESLLLLYERAMRADDFVHFCESRNLARALELTGRPAYLEAFLSTTSAEYRQLADQTRPL